MLNFGDYFKSEYRYTLSNVNFGIIENDPDGDVTARIFDNIDTEIKGNVLYIRFVREICFEPEAVFNLQVAFLVMLTIKDDMLNDAKDIDWKKEISDQPDNAYLSNVIARAAGLIADISSSYGQTPFVTPPTLIK